MTQIDYTPKSWSYSAIHSYEECPLNYVLDKLATGPRETNWALENGLRIHSLMEQYLLGNIDGVPKDLECFSAELRNLKAKGATAEGAIVLDKNWQPLKVKDPWKSKKAWIRAKLDAQLGDLIIDLKTGNVYDHYTQQGDLYATMTLQVEPELDKIDVEFWYSKSGEITSDVYYRKDQEERLEKWNKKATRMMNEKNWFPKQNFACRWCNHQDKCELF